MHSILEWLRHISKIDILSKLNKKNMADVLLPPDIKNRVLRTNTIAANLNHAITTTLQAAISPIQTLFDHAGLLMNKYINFLVNTFKKRRIFWPWS